MSPEAQTWIDGMVKTANGGISPATATQRLADYGNDVIAGHVRTGAQDPRSVPRRMALAGCAHSRPHPDADDHNGVVDRAFYAWLADECSRSTVKNTLAILERAVRDGVVDRNVARVSGWQHEYQQAEDELDDPRTLALPSWEALTTLADALVARSRDGFTGWGHIVMFAACTAARIGEVPGVRAT
ncbi:hypothetical protein AB0J56_46180 [Actinoplanes xinjiangensis]